MDVLPDQGSLAETPLPELLLVLQRERFDGTLELTREKVTKTITLEKGAPVLSESNLERESLPAQLAETRVITPAARDRVEAYVRQKRCKEATALLTLKLIDPKQLLAAMKEQVRRRLTDCFGWPDGRFVLERRPGQGAEVQPFRVEPAALVQRALEAQWSPDRLLERLTPHLERYSRTTRGAEAVVQRMELDPPAQILVARLDGTQTLASAIGAAAGSLRALAAVWVLDAAGVLAHAEEPVVVETEGEEDEPEVEIEVSIVGGEDSPAADAKAKPKEAAKPEGESDQQTAEREALRQELLSTYERLGDLSYYEILGIPEKADAIAIKKAYFKLVKLYHPDALGRIGLKDISRQAQDVFAKAAQAFEVLSSPPKRRDYDAKLSGEDEDIDVERLAQAEANFRKGEVLLKMGNFRGALEFLEPAVQLWPKEADYQSAYGWSLYKAAPSQPEKAREHLQLAVDLKPDDSEAWSRLGTVLRALGDEDAAAEATARARR